MDAECDNTPLECDDVGKNEKDGNVSEKRKRKEESSEHHHGYSLCQRTDTFYI